MPLRSSQLTRVYRRSRHHFFVAPPFRPSEITKTSPTFFLIPGRVKPGSPRIRVGAPWATGLPTIPRSPGLDRGSPPCSPGARVRGAFQARGARSARDLGGVGPRPSPRPPRRPRPRALLPRKPLCAFPPLSATVTPGPHPARSAPLPGLASETTPSTTSPPAEPSASSPSAPRGSTGAGLRAGTHTPWRDSSTFERAVH